MKISKPNEITICLIGSKNIVDQQIEDLFPLTQEYKVDFWKRYERNPNLYWSFSQIINEAVMQAKSEFLIFLNDKVDINCNYIQEIITDLCNGFALSSYAIFGFWGTTKELFRSIGMLDESFIGGEYEDLDLLLRIKLINKAINWRGNQYLYHWSIEAPHSIMRGAAYTYFHTKWIQRGSDTYILDSDYKEKIFSDNSSKKDIYESWNTWNQDSISGGNTLGDFIIKNPNIYYGKFKKSEHRGVGKISISSLKDNPKTVKIEYLSDVKSMIHIILVQAETDRERELMYRKTLYNNFWHVDDVYSDIDLNKPCEIKIFCQGDKIYHNKYATFPLNLNFEIGIKYIQKILLD